MSATVSDLIGQILVPRPATAVPGVPHAPVDTASLGALIGRIPGPPGGAPVVQAARPAPVVETH